jgi:hypothetical protein
MQVDKVPFPMHTIEARPLAILIRREQADTTQGKNVLYRQTMCCTECQNKFRVQGGIGEG